MEARRRCFDLAKLERYLGGESLASGRGMMSALEQHPARLFQIDEFGLFLSSVAGNKAPTHKAEIWSELMKLRSRAKGVHRGTECAENARTHSPSQVAQIAASIAEFGFVNPVLVDAQGVLIAGHGRVMAAKQRGLASVPVLWLGHLSPAQARALALRPRALRPLRRAVAGPRACSAAPAPPRRPGCWPAPP